MKKIQEEKNEAKMFEEALGLMGLDFDSEAHVCTIFDLMKCAFGSHGIGTREPSR